MARHHYLPASFLALFSTDTTTLPSRKRLLAAGDKENGNIIRTSASNLGCINNLYTLVYLEEDPYLIDQTWEEYEKLLPQAINKLKEGTVDSETWIRVLVPFVACMLVRGPDFDRRFHRRMRSLGFADSDFELNADHSNRARLFEIQRLLGPVAVARWIVLSIHGKEELITNDLGYAPFRNSLTEEAGLAIPLGKSRILLVIPLIERQLVRAEQDKWVPIIEYIDSPDNDHLGLNQAINRFAQRFIFGPDEESIKRYFDRSYKSHYSLEPQQLGFITGPEALAHEFTWHRLATAVRRHPEEEPWDFQLNYEVIADGWCPPVMFPVNLIEFPPALERVQNEIVAKFYNPEIYFVISQIHQLEKMGDMSAVVEVCTKGISQATSTEHKVRLLISRGGAYADLENYSEAYSDFDEALALEPHNPIAHTDLGYTHLKNNKLAEALDSFNKAIEIDPKLGHAYLNRGSAYTNIKDLDQALKDFKTAITLLPRGLDSAHAHMNKGNIELIDGNFSDAIKDFSYGIKIFTDSNKRSNCLYHRGLAYYSVADYDKALTDLTQAIEFSKDPFDSLVLRAQIYLMRQENLLSIEDLISAVSHTNDKSIKSEMLRRCGVGYSELGKYNEAMQCFDEAIDLAEDKGFVSYDRGVSLLSFGKIIQAIKAFEFTLSNDPNNPKALNNMGICQSLEREYALALTYFDRSISSSSDEYDLASAHRNKALALCFLSRFREADEELKMAEKIDPNTINTLIARGRYEWHRENYKKALELQLSVQERMGAEVQINPFVFLPQLSLGQAKGVVSDLTDWSNNYPPPISRIAIRHEFELLRKKLPDRELIDQIIDIINPQ